MNYQNNNNRRNVNNNNNQNLNNKNMSNDNKNKISNSDVNRNGNRNSNLNGNLNGNRNEIYRQLNQMNNQQINKNAEKVYKQVLKDVLVCQEATKVFIARATHVNDVNVTIDAVHRAMEVAEACNLFTFFLVNSSPNLKASVLLLDLVVKTFQKELTKLKNDPCCEEIVSKTIEVNDSLIKSLNKLKRNLE